MAHYLTAVIPDATCVRVSGDEIEVVPALGARLYVVPPAGVAAFIDAFDLSPERFPALSDETA